MRHSAGLLLTLMMLSLATPAAASPSPLVLGGSDQDTGQAPPQQQAPRRQPPRKAQAASRQLPPMPQKLVKLYSKIGALWNGNRMLYCEATRAISETIAEIRKLRDVKSAGFDPGSNEIQLVTREGGSGSIEISNMPALKDHPNCLRD